MVIDEHLTERARGAMIGLASATRLGCLPKVCQPRKSSNITAV